MFFLASSPSLVKLLVSGSGVVGLASGFGFGVDCCCGGTLGEVGCDATLGFWSRSLADWA
jgi:hypothetical protein